MTLKRRAAALGLVLVLILSVWLLGTYASPMTDRRIDRSVGAHLAALEERVRALETMVGGGRQAAIVSQMIPDRHAVSSPTYADMVPPGPEVTVRVGPVGKVRVELSAFFDAQVASSNAGPGSEESILYISFEVRDADGGVVLLPSDERAIALGASSFVQDGVGSEFEALGISSRLMDISDLPRGDLTFTAKARRDGTSALNPGGQKRLLTVTPY